MHAFLVPSASAAALSTLCRLFATQRRPESRHLTSVAPPQRERQRQGISQEARGCGSVNPPEPLCLLSRAGTPRARPELRPSPESRHLTVSASARVPHGSLANVVA